MNLYGTALVALLTVQGETMRRPTSRIRLLITGALFGAMLLCLTQASVSSAVATAFGQRIEGKAYAAAATIKIALQVLADTTNPMLSGPAPND